MPAWNGKINAKTMELWSHSSEAYLRLRVAAYVQTPASLLAELLNDSDENVKRQVMMNPNLERALLDKLLQSQDQDILATCLRNPNVPSTFLISQWRNLTPDLSAFALAHPNFPIDELIIIRQTHSARILSALAKNPQLQSDFLNDLVQKENHYVREVVAQHPNATPELLTRLSADENGYVINAVAQHPRTPTSVLESLFSQQPLLRSSLVKNPNLSVSIIETLVQQKFALKTLAKHPNLPMHYFLDFIQHPEIAVRCAIAQNPKLPLSYLFYLANDTVTIVRHQAIANERVAFSFRDLFQYRAGYQLPQPVTQVILEADFAEALTSLTAKILIRQIKKLRLEVGVVVQLAIHSDSEVRRQVAQILTLPQATYLQLANDEASGVRRQIAKNPSVSGAILEKLNYDTPSVRRSLCENRKLPRYLLTILLQTHDESVQAMAVANQNLSLEQLAQYANSLEPLIRRNVAKNPSSSAQILTKLAYDPIASVREAVAKNWHTPQMIVKLLTADADPLVSKYAILNYDAQLKKQTRE